MRLRTAVAATLTAVALALGVTACGEDDDGGRSAASTSAKPTTTPAADSTNPTPRPTSGDVVVAALGDSITAGSPLYDPDPAIRERIGATLDPTSQWMHWYRAENPRYRFKNCGVFGERTDEIAKRLDDCAEGAKVLVVQGGINDIAQGRDIADAADDITTMIRQGKELGMRVATVEVLPWNNGYPDADPLITELNGLIRRTAKAEGVPVFPWYSALEDPKARGRMRQDLTDDGNHPSVAGYRQLATTVRLP